MAKDVLQLDRVVIRIAGDSGDGMQLTGDRFTQETASFGNDLSTLPNFPAEIRAPAGTLPGVSSFQLHFADHDILTPGDRPDVLVAMNPAALKANVADVPANGTVIVDTHDFTSRALARVGWDTSPIEDGSLDAFHVHALDLTQLTLDALAGSGLSRKDAGRSKNMFALGLLSWMYSRPTEGTLRFLREKFAAKEPDRRGQHHRVQSGLELRRDDRGLRRVVRDQAGRPAGRDVPQHHRQPGPVLRPGGRRAPFGAAAVPRRLPDHPGVRHPA